MAEQLEALTKENERLKQELSVLRQEKEKANPVSFKERYAVKILNSLPDMLTVFDHNEIGIEVVSNEETNHVGVTNEDFVGMHMRNMVLRKPIRTYIPICSTQSQQGLSLPHITNWISTASVTITKTAFSHWTKSMY